MSMATLAELKKETSMLPKTMPVSMDTLGGFETMQRMAELLSTSQIVPKRYQGNRGSCFIAVDMALRIGASPLLVMQNMYDVYGTPAWSAQFLIATFNKSGRFSALRYEFQGKPGNDDWGCRAVAIELATNEKLEGPLITIEMAKKSGWYSKIDRNGNESSKWQTMPEQMLRYRAAAWFVRAYAPEIAMGLQTAEEVEDKVITIDATSFPQDNSMSMEDVKEKVEKPKRGRKKAAELPTAETTTVDVTPEPAKQEVKPEPPQGEEPPLVEFLQHPENHPGVEPEKEPIQPADDYDEDEDRFYSTSANENKTAEGDIECPDPLPDGSPRYVSEAQCKTCLKFKGCPNWS